MASANLPVGFGLSMHFSDVQVAASDRPVAYSCMTPGTLQGKASAPQVIVTHDAGATWAATARIAETWNVCDHLVIDQLNPAIVLAYGYSNAGEQAAMSVDGGESWRMLATNGLDEMKQATIGVAPGRCSPSRRAVAPRLCWLSAIVRRIPGAK